MTAEQIYAELDRAGLTPPVHYAAAPHEWREALRSLAEQLEVITEARFSEGSREGCTLALEENGSELKYLERENAELKKQLAALKESA